jgi:two-component sensor histidine kinase
LLNRFFLLFFFLLNISNGFAQDPFYQILDKKDGLPSNTVYDIIQDSKGFIWVAHDEGLSRFDGFHFKNYESITQTSKAGSCIIEDSLGRIWYSNFDGYIYYIENDSMKELKMGTPLGYTRFGVSNNTIYTIEENGVRFYHFKTLKPIGFYPKIFTHYASAAMIKDAFVVQDSSFYFFENATLTKTISTQSINHFKTGNLLFNNNNTLPILICREQLSDYLISFKPKENYPKFKIPIKGFFQNYSFTGDYFWASSPTGVYGFDKSGKLIGSERKPFFSKYNISNVFKDNQGNYWFATLSDGLLFVPDLGVRIYDNLENKPMRIAERESDIIVGNWNGNIQSFDFLSEPKQLFHSEGHSIGVLFYDKENKKTIFANRFFQVSNQFWDIEQKSRFSLKDIIKVDHKYYAFAVSGLIGFTHTYFQNKPSIWDSIFDANPYYHQFHKYSTWLSESVRAKSVAAIYDANQVYYATHKGIYCITPKQLTNVKNKGQNVFTQKLQGNGKRIFCISSLGELFEILPNQTFKSISIPIQFKDLKYSNGYLFLIGENLLYCMNMSDTANKITRLQFMANNQEINDLVFVKGKLIVATNLGLISAPLKLVGPTKFHPPFFISKLFLDGQNTQLKNNLKFPHSFNEVEIIYSVLAYNFYKNTPLYYQINSGEWQLCDPNTRSLKLLALSPGMYQIRFRFEGFDAEPNGVDFEIETPYYQKWWFFVSIFIFISAIFMAFSHVRMQRLKEKNRLEMEKVELEKSLGQSMLTAIKSQMNPHFFYNALNTIQSYIYTNDRQNASSYLSKFSKLTRLILEMSEKESVTLSDEIKALLLYIELEKGRFDENDFDYEFKIEDDLEVELIQIPSMMVQPYIENAVKHGLLHKVGKKSLQIEFKKHNDFLLITVTDNGIGRSKSEQINASKKEKWNSFATQANQKRIELLNKGRVQHIGISITDLYNETGHSTGTEVLISIPLNQD